MGRVTSVPSESPGPKSSPVTCPGCACQAGVAVQCEPVTQEPGFETDRERGEMKLGVLCDTYKTDGWSERLLDTRTDRQRDTQTSVTLAV